LAERSATGAFPARSLHNVSIRPAIAQSILSVLWSFCDSQVISGKISISRDSRLPLHKKTNKIPRKNEVLILHGTGCIAANGTPQKCALLHFWTNGKPVLRTVPFPEGVPSIGVRIGVSAIRWWVRRGPNLTSPRIVRDQVNDDGYCTVFLQCCPPSTVVFCSLATLREAWFAQTTTWHTPSPPQGIKNVDVECVWEASTSVRPFRSTFRSSAGPAEPGCIICERTCGHRTDRFCIYEAREPSIFPVRLN